MSTVSLLSELIAHARCVEMFPEDCTLGFTHQAVKNNRPVMPPKQSDRSPFYYPGFQQQQEQVLLPQQHSHIMEEVLCEYRGGHWFLV